MENTYITKEAAALGSSQTNVTRIMKLLYSHVEVAYRQLQNAQEEICRQNSQRCGMVEIGATETALPFFY